MMDRATRIFRREAEQTDHPLGLGWLLAIALCGGILLFTTVGLLLVWWVKKTRHPGPQTVYGYAATQSSLMPGSSSRLIKKRLLGSGSLSKLSSRFSSRFSFSAQSVPPPPPLPTHESFRLPERRRTVSRGRKRSRSWVDEDDLHGPKMSRNMQSAKEAYGWFGLVPTLPNVETVPEKEEPVHDGVPLYHPQPRWLPRSQTEPKFSYPMSHNNSSAPSRHGSLPMGIAPAGGMKMPVPRPAHMKASATDSNLRGILRSTDIRLSERRSSLSPVKISRSSAVRGSPTKTVRSQRSGSSGRSGHDWRAPGSPPKRSHSQRGSRSNSISSIGSAANSLIAAATQELELPGGLSSPSKTRGVRREQQQQGQQRTAHGSPERAQRVSHQNQGMQRHSPQRYSPQRHGPQMMAMPQTQMQVPQMQFPQMQYPQLPFPYMQQQQQNSPQRSPERRKSFDSDRSSSLSTLYSANEPEEEEPRQRQGEDPFVDRGGPKRWPSWQMRFANGDSQRRAKTLSSASLSHFMMGGEPSRQTSCPPPLRPISAISQPDMGREGVVSPLVLEPPTTALAPDASSSGPDTSTSMMPYLNTAPSEASFVSMSVESDATDVPSNETQRVDWLDSSDSTSSSPTTPTGRARFADASTLSSSPYDEREIMSLLLATAPSQRSLPPPPSTMAGGVDGSIITLLSPPPRGSLVRHPSTSSSIYTLESFLAEPGAMLTGSPSQRSAIHPFLDGPRVSNTVAELRRMNSVLSTFSVTSLNSLNGHDESPTLSTSWSGSTASRPLFFGAGSIGSRHYLNVGNTRSSLAAGSLLHRYGSRGSRHRRAETYHFGKENQGLGLRLSCIMDETLDIDPQKGTAPTVNVVCEPAMEIIEGIPTGVLGQKLGPVDELLALDHGKGQRRDSLESLGLYDNDGFLLSSPERDAKKRRALRI